MKKQRQMKRAQGLLGRRIVCCSLQQCSARISNISETSSSSPFEYTKTSVVFSCKLHLICTFSILNRIVRINSKREKPTSIAALPNHKTYPYPYTLIKTVYRILTPMHLCMTKIFVVSIAIFSVK